MKRHFDPRDPDTFNLDTFREEQLIPIQLDSQSPIFAQFEEFRTGAPRIPFMTTAELEDIRGKYENILRNIAGIAGLLFLGPGPAALFSFIGEKIGKMADTAVAVRFLKDKEWDLLHKIYGNLLPSYNNIILTSDIGAGGRPFTIPATALGNLELIISPWLVATKHLNDGRILINLGSAMMNPKLSLLVHEAMHACQFANSDITAITLCKAAYYAGTKQYQFEPGHSWENYNTEQQAEIMEAWFVDGCNPSDELSSYARIINSQLLSIDEKYTQLGGPVGFLQNATSEEIPTRDRIGTCRHYNGGSIYRHPRHGTFGVGLGVRTFWELGGAETGPLGYPVSDSIPTPDGLHRFNHFEGGTIFINDYEDDNPKIWLLKKAISEKWFQHGWINKTGKPTGSESFKKGIGAAIEFEKGWSIYKSENATCLIGEEIQDKWRSVGAGQSFLGYPIIDMSHTAGGDGKFCHFQGGSIYWNPTAGAHAVHGDIREKWSVLSWEHGFLGYPLTDETITPDGRGRFNEFQGGVIYWSPQTGAFEVHGDIRAKWVSVGQEIGVLGYPTTDEFLTPNQRGRCNHFQNGSIFWTPFSGAHALYGPIRDAWLTAGAENGSLGFPISDITQIDNSSTLRCEFEGGHIDFIPGVGVRTKIKGDEPLTPEEKKELKRETNPHVFRGRRGVDD